jgi:hypothetical protein
MGIKLALLESGNIRCSKFTLFVRFYIVVIGNSSAIVLKSVLGLRVYIDVKRNG